MLMRKILESATRLVRRTPAASSSETDDVPRDVRFELGHGATASLTVYPNDHRAEPQVCKARLINLSKHRARLATDAEVPVGGSLRLELQLEELGLSLYVAAEVCWAKRHDDGAYEIGCSLEPGLPEGVLDKMAQAGDFDRWASERREEPREFTLLRRLDDAEETAVLKDYSRGGFCLATGHPCVPGQEVYLRLDGDESREIVAKTLWQVQVDGGYLLGCVFLSERDREYIESLYEQAQTREDLQESSATETT